MILLDCENISLSYILVHHTCFHFHILHLYENIFEGKKYIKKLVHSTYVLHNRNYLVNNLEKFL